MASLPPAGKPLATNIQPNGWSRRDRPCDACRRRKSRCIIPDNVGTCVMCQSRSEECTFVQDPKRRKRRRLEEENSPEGITTKPPIDDYDALPVSLLKQTLGLQNRQHGQYLGQTSEYDVRLINLSSFNARGEHVSTPGTLRRVSPHDHFIMKSESQAEIDEELANLDLVESVVQPYGRALVDLYFRIIHPSFPIMHKKVFLEKYERSYREFTPPVLAAVYILSLNWWSYTPELANLAKPDSKKLEKLMPQFLSTVLNRPKLSTVQAGLLLLQCPGSDSWALTGQLVAVSQNLGLHLDSSNWRIPEWERSLRKRLAWALYMQDKWGALVHGRPPLIHAENWTVLAVEDRDFPETAEDDDDEEGSSDIETGRLTFIHMIALTDILTDILSTFFSLRATGRLRNERENALTETLRLAKPIQIRLKEWHANLPACLAMGKTRARKLSPTGSLHLAYFATEVTLHRAIIRFDTPPSPTPPLPPASTADPNDIRTITRLAARTRLLSSLSLLSSLQPPHLQSSWYFSSSHSLAIIGTFGCLLWATSSTPQEAEFYREKLAEYRWMLRVQAGAAGFMKLAVGMLDESPVFVKDGLGKDGSKPTTPVASVGAREGQVKERVAASSRQQPTKASSNTTLDPAQNLQPSNEVSPSNATSSTFESGGQNSYEQEADVQYNDPRHPWSDFTGQGADFTSTDVQGWSLDQMYNFDNFQVAEELLARGRFVEEYDEEVHNFAGF